MRSARRRGIRRDDGRETPAAGRSRTRSDSIRESGRLPGQLPPAGRAARLHSGKRVVIVNDGDGARIAVCWGR